jgi:hypothetical protein
LCLLNPAVLVVSGLSDVLGAIGRILLSYLVHMHGRLRSLGQGQVHVGPITWEVLPHPPLPQRTTSWTVPPYGRRRGRSRGCGQRGKPYPAVKEANRRARSVQPSHGCALPQLRHNWRSNSGAQAHTSCNRRAGYHVQRSHTAACANALSSRDCHGF